MIKWILKKTVGSSHDRQIKQMWPQVHKINEYAESFTTLSDDALRAKTEEFKQRLSGGETTDDILPEAYAVVKEACRRLLGMDFEVTGLTKTWDMVPYDVQLIGAISLHKGGIAEMQTGEGKTLVAIMPLYLNGLTGKSCHLVTVNDFLALRDSQWVGCVLEWLGLKVGCIQNAMRPDEKREQYACDVTYGTNSEFGFDYLRDMGMAAERDQLVQREHYFVIVDEIDSILIDEARTPLIISGPAAVSTHLYDKLKPDVETLVKKQSQLCTRMITEAKDILDKASDEDGIDEDAILMLYKVKLGMPKHKQLLRLLEDPKILQQMEKLTLQMHSDQNRAFLQEIKDSMYFAIDEKAGDTDLSELGRTTLRPNDPDSFMLPDLVTEFQVIDSNEAFSDEEKAQAREENQREFDLRSETIHNISQLLRAYCVFEKDVQYVVQESKVMIVDEFTGRLMPGRRYSEGLHQALEAKESVTIERETQTLATITIQNYFRIYEKLAGMTGTAETEASEFKEIYGLDVLVIPTNRPCIRDDYDDRVFKTKQEKYKALIEEVRECHEAGQPMLIGTTSVEISEVLSRMLRRDKIPHTVLNAKNHAHEADIIARAGQKGAVTIATNMAGRGTDIKLGPGVVELGGLHVIGSERHDARRIDRQLRGRCARQGDHGSSRFYISLQDDLMRLFGSDRIAKLMEKLGFEEGDELSHPLLNRTIENAQRKVEQIHFSSRKDTLKYDDVMNKQREVIYGRRREVLYAEEPRDQLMLFIEDSVYDHILDCSLDVKEHGTPIDRDPLLHWLRTTFPIGFTEDDVKVNTAKYDADAYLDQIMKRIGDAYALKEKGEDPDHLKWLERQVILSAHDKPWQEHLYAMDAMRQGIRLMGLAQRDPLVEYKKEAFEMFGGLINEINNEICCSLFRSATSLEAFQSFITSLPQEEQHQMLGQFASGEAPASPRPVAGLSDAFSNDMMDFDELQHREKGITYQREQPKVGRNNPCPCGSGQKYKKCCGR